MTNFYKTDPVFKKDSKGKIRVWYAECNDTGWRTIAGLIDGKQVVSEWSKAIPASQDTPFEQAKFEALSERRSKLETGYMETIDTIDDSSYFRPMLAKEWESDYEGFSQPKLDGMRCIASKAGLYSRNGKEILSVPHIVKHLNEVFFSKYPNLILDGEIYNHEYKDDFNSLMSMARKSKPTMLDDMLAEQKLQYHIYDCYNPDKPELKFSERFYNFEFPDELWEHNGNYYCHLVPTQSVYTLEDLNILNEEYIRNGYEGQMLRKDDVYEQKRSKVLQKRKEFITEEFTIMDVVEGEGNWTGFAKSLTLKDKNEKVFSSGIRGSQSKAKELLVNKDRVIGSEATVRFFQYTPDGVPRFPVCIDIHDGKRVD